ncbi:MAG: L,D-transpeptidase family protein [Lachnospiraceae bacterium]|nr:L,D-transpeptidase family protein [Lachnospiraceae bacterium]
MSNYRDDHGVVNPNGVNNEGSGGFGPAGEELLAELNHEYERPSQTAGSMSNAKAAREAKMSETAETAVTAGEGVVAANAETAVTAGEGVVAANAETAVTAGEGVVAANAETATKIEETKPTETAETAEPAKAEVTDTIATAAGSTDEISETASVGTTETAGTAVAGTQAAAPQPASTAADVAASSDPAPVPPAQPDPAPTQPDPAMTQPAPTPPAQPEPPVPEKRTSIWVKLLRTTLLLAAIIGAFVFYYVTQSYQYNDKFMIGTYVNGNDVSGQTVEQVEEDIRERVEDSYSLTLTFRDGSKETITPEEIGYRYVSTGEVEQAMNDQNPLTWVLRNMGKTVEIDVPENHTFDEAKLAEIVKAMPEFQVENVVTPTNAYLNITDKNEFEIVPETQGNAPIADAILPTLNELVTNSETEGDLNDIKGSYETPTVTADNPDLVYQCDNLNKFLSTKITYKLPKDVTKTIDRGMLINWVTRQDNGYYYLDDTTIHDNCAKYVADIAKEVDERHNSIPFPSTNSGTINLSCAEYGHVIDQPGETEALFKEIKECKSEEKEPLYSLNKNVDARFGGTYVEADLSNQHVYYYENGQLVLDTPCVSGTKYDSSRHTVLGLYSIYYKQRNRTLRGPMVNGVPSYTSFVNFWMPFYKGYGLHDASWRGSFGGTIYYSSGSHGCINLPYNAAATLYEHTEVGTPVIVFGGY